MASKSPLKSLPVRGRASGELEGVPNKRWRQLERVAQALRSLGDTPITHVCAERLAQRFGVHRATIYRYRSRLAEIDEVTAIAGRTRGWKPLASRLSAKREQGIEEAIDVTRGFRPLQTQSSGRGPDCSGIRLGPQPPMPGSPRPESTTAATRSRCLAGSSKCAVSNHPVEVHSTGRRSQARSPLRSSPYVLMY